MQVYTGQQREKNNYKRHTKLLVWRNDAKSPTHYYAPFPGQISASDFLKFYTPYTFFENDLHNIY